ncbi:MAG: molecular chaperone DnaJ, partial [Candidatus Pacebacteria bacterium]|nr:molecular chaperone DnaJ [Candidatus Paceibacterota bacterium]
TQSGQVFRLKGKGIPSLRGSGRGDQHVKVRVEVPTKLSDAQKEKVKALAGDLSESSYPILQKFRKRVKNLWG